MLKSIQIFHIVQLSLHVLRKSQEKAKQVTQNDLVILHMI